MVIIQGYTSGIAILCLVLIIAFLFWRLKNVNWYSVSIYIFLALFWTIMVIVRKSFDSHHTKHQLPLWAWPIIIASYQFIQVMTRIPLGKLSAKLHSRQLPLLLTTFSILISGILMTASNFAIWSIVISVVATGFFGATYGLQNQYWSENYNRLSTFMTVALITILPSLASLLSTFLNDLLPFKASTQDMHWFLMGIMIFLTLIIIAYIIFPERKNTVLKDNMHLKGKDVSRLNLKHVASLSTSAVLLTLSYHLLNRSAFSFQDMIASEGDSWSTIFTAFAIAVGILTALLFIRFIKSYHLAIIGQVLQITGLILGIIEAFVFDSFALTWIYWIIMTAGFIIFQNTMVGVMLHFDQKSTLLVLGIWLTFRSAATGLGVVITQEVKAYTPSEINWIFIPALILAFLSFWHLLLIYRKSHFKVFEVTDHYERMINKKIWK